jgi:uncharacterized protein (DUF58 family)
MRILRTLFPAPRLFAALGTIVLLFVLDFITGGLFLLGQLAFLVFVALMITDLVLLYRLRQGIHGVRFTPDKLSNGDDNPIRIYLENRHRFPAGLTIYDEVPHQFQRRDIAFRTRIAAKNHITLEYTLRPVKRGEYEFGAVNTMAHTPLGLFRRRYRFSADKKVAVYPGFLQMRRYELLAISDRLTEAGVKRIRRLGHNLEFEQIKEYVTGDDFRTLNWKATARRTSLMVNAYQDERSQQVYSLIDKGRTMQMPFGGLSLLDYAINASLVISNIALRKSDKAGIITFQHKVNSVLPASRRSTQMLNILDLLYSQKTAYREADFASLTATVRRRITQRSLLLLFTNFETVSGLRRQLPYLRQLSQQHLLVVIFFENTELHARLVTPATDLKEVYIKAIAEKYALEKKLIVKELSSAGIQALLTAPEKLTANTVNKYIELKARGQI